MKLLVLSNGHGEDVIATRIIERLLQETELEIRALPIVGQGHAYQKPGISIVGRVQQMPSGGFIYQGGSPLWQDLRGGLVRLTLEQIKSVRQWGKAGGKILAVGDIVPLLYGWVSQADYAFVGTAKSDYYLQDESGWLEQTSWLQRKFNSDYLPWERWLMSHNRCKAVFPRDSLTAKGLQRWQIPAYDLGNPMMDSLTPKSEARMPEELNILLLPGSRMPEAIRNWQQILIGVWATVKAMPRPNLKFRAAIAPALDLKAFELHALTQGWQVRSRNREQTVMVNHSSTLALTREQNRQFFQQADIAIAMAGTATEQFVGLGKPAVIFPGNGPQFTPAFAEAQSRLLGCSIVMIDSAIQTGDAIAKTIQNEGLLAQIALNGERRMGKAGAAKRIANCLQATLLSG